MRYQVPVQLAQRSYTVHIGDRLLPQLGPLATAALQRQAHRAFLVADARVPASVVITAADSLKSVGLTVRSWAVKPSEHDKSFATLERILIEMARAKLDRDDFAVSLGGGIVGDITGFAAAIYKRGVETIACPTTLLAMVDASVGGKTGINLNTSDNVTADLKKNLVGSFHQPRLVLADVDLLRSLPPRIFRNGLAECIKHAILARGPRALDPALMDWMATALPAILAGDPKSIAELVARNVAVKAHFVTSDEREEAPDDVEGRALLNLGHTFGHAIETLPNLSPDSTPTAAPLQHGEAVGLGMLAAAACSQHLGLCTPSLREQILRLLLACSLPVSLQGLPPLPDLVERMSHDKKVRGGTPRLILPTTTPDGTPTGASVVAGPPVQAIQAGLESIIYRT